MNFLKWLSCVPFCQFVMFYHVHGVEFYIGINIFCKETTIAEAN